MTAMNDLEFSDAVKRVDDAEAEGDYSKALSLCKELSIFNSCEPLILRIGYLEKKLHRYNEAIFHFNKALALRSDRAITYISKAQCLISLKEFGEAAESLRQAVKIDSRPDALVLLGFAHETLGKKTKAQYYYRLAVRVDPDWEEAHYNVGRLLRIRQPKKALKSLRLAVRLDVNYKWAYLELAKTYVDLHRYKSARKALEKVISIDDSLLLPHLFLANLFWMMGKLSKAAEEYIIACKLDCSLFSLKCYKTFLVTNACHSDE